MKNKRSKNGVNLYGRTPSHFFLGNHHTLILKKTKLEKNMLSKKLKDNKSKSNLLHENTSTQKEVQKENKTTGNYAYFILVIMAVAFFSFSLVKLFLIFRTVEDTVYPDEFLLDFYNEVNKRIY